MAEKVELLGQGQGLGVLAAKLQSGQDGQGQDGAGGHLSLGIVPMSHRLEGIVYNAKGRYSLL